jgi:hypothetical protein
MPWTCPVCTLVNPDGAVVCEVCSIPNPVTIPSPAFLVIGAKPSDRIDGRSFYGDPAYYTYDSKLGEVGPRHIIASFNDVDINRKLANFYYQKFDIIIFDLSTDKYRDGKHHSIFFLLNMLKPGGLFITEFQTAAIVIDPILLGERNSRTTIDEYVKTLYIKNAQQKANEFSLFEPSGFSKRLLSVDSLTAENPVARTVYTGGFHITYRDAPTFMVLTKPDRVSPEQEKYHRELGLAFEANARGQQKGAPAPPSEIWTCPFCTVHNKAGSPTCKVCESWRCSTCTFVNQPGAAACGECGTPKPGGGARGGSLAKHRKTKRRKYTKRRRVCQTRRIKKQNRS